MDWDLIQKMRQGFLDTEGHLPDYWQDERWLSAYEQTLAQRIRWKWQAVLQVLAPQLEALQSVTQIVDWGCGTGIATRSFLARTGWKGSHVALLDRSPVAARFAGRMVEQECPGQTIEIIRNTGKIKAPYVLLVSHVLSELDERSLSELQSLAQGAAALVWVEPGRTLESRRLGQIREAMRNSHSILGPCRHAEACGALQPGREADWCHFFAPVPGEVHQSAFWREFSKRMHVDLRSLPVSWLAAARPTFIRGSIGPNDDALILGRPRVFKGYTRWLACTAAGLEGGDFPKKQDKTLHQILSDAAFMTLVDRQALQRKTDASL